MPYLPDCRSECVPGSQTADPHRRYAPAVLTSWLRRLWRRVHQFHVAQAELHERMWLRGRPWEEEFLHWTPDGQLHGSLVPPRGRRRRHSATRDGWCAAHRP